jgi:arabinofuranosyltransferase
MRPVDPMSARLSLSEPRLPRLAAVACVAVQATLLIGALLRFYRRFVYDEASGRVWGLADDMYISASFGRTLFAGGGLVWYPGAPRIEGISNPLWTLLIGALQRLPGFREDRLGLWVLCLNASLLAATAALFVRTLGLALGARRPLLAIYLLTPAVFALAYWCAEGFELALLALLGFAMLTCALRPRTLANALALGLLLVLGFATRMDFLFAALPALFCLATQRVPDEARRWRISLLLASAGIAALLLARRAYYADWLPNTYYLKATGWQLSARLQRGAAQNGAQLAALLPLFLPLSFAPIRRRLAAHLPLVLAAWLGFAASVFYSTYVGGEAWRIFAGYDRHTAVGGLFLIWGQCVFVHGLGGRWPVRLSALAWSLALSTWVAAGGGGLAQLRAGLFERDSPVRELERQWIAYGKVFEEVSRPGARIALCPAGAIVYFAHRGGVDLLGKIEPLVAHLTVAPSRPANNRCWRSAPGHNKEDDAAVFAARQPEFSRYEPPLAQRARYRKFSYKGQRFFVLRDTPWLALPP